jgi:hypothetical protein
MFKFRKSPRGRSLPKSQGEPVLLESLEDRRLLSASLHHHHKSAAAVHTSAVTTVPKVVKATTTTTTTPTDSDGDGDGSGSGKSSNSTTYSALQTSDAAAATELQTLATADGQTIAGTQSVSVHQINSTTTYYSVVLAPSAGTEIKLTTDQAGNPVVPPTSSQTTFGDSSIPAAATAEITSLASLLGATAPVSTDAVTVRTANGLTTYTISLAPSTTSTTTGDIRITVDAAGNPAGPMKIPFSALPAKVSAGLTTLATADSTTIPTTQDVFIHTGGGVTTYTVDLNSSGQSLQLTVDTTGAAATPASGGDGFGGGGGWGDRGGGGWGGGFGGGFGGFGF